MQEIKQLLKFKYTQQILLIVPLFVLLIFLGFSYLSFSTYKPEVPVSSEEVKGASNDLIPPIPFPMDAQKISDDTTQSGRLVAIQTTRSPEIIKSFYANVLIDRSWELDKEFLDGEVYTATYKNPPHFLNISASRQENHEDLTVVTMEIYSN